MFPLSPSPQLGNSYGLVAWNALTSPSSNFTKLCNSVASQYDYLCVVANAMCPMEWISVPFIETPRQHVWASHQHHHHHHHLQSPPTDMAGGHGCQNFIDNGSSCSNKCWGSCISLCNSTSLQLQPAFAVRWCVGMIGCSSVFGRSFLSFSHPINQPYLHPNAFGY